LAQATKKRAAAPRRKKASVTRKRASSTRRAQATGARKNSVELTAKQKQEAAAATLARAASIGQMARLFREVGGIVCLFAALIALLALASFSVNDPGWSHTGTDDNIRNSVGRAGAWFADVSFYLLGYMAYLIPLVVGLCGWLLFRNNRSAQHTYQPFIVVRLIGVMLMLMSASGLADLHINVGQGSLPQGTYGGGVLGTAVAWWLVSIFQHLGTTLILLAVFFSSLTLAFGTSWLRLVEMLGGLAIYVVDAIRGQYRSLLLARDEYNKIVVADQARQDHVAEQAGERKQRKHRWFGRRKDVVPDPLLDADATAGPGAAGMTAALAMARNKAASVTQAEQTAVDANNRFDALGDSLVEADALLDSEFDKTIQIDRTTADALREIDSPPSKADQMASKSALPTIDLSARKKKIAIKQRASEQKQTKLFLDVPDSDLPPLSLLDAPEPQRPGFSDSDLQALSRLLEEKLAEFRIAVQVVAVHPGPVITRFEMELAPGIKASRITSLSQDIARSMSLVSVRVVEVIAGKSTIGIEVPNDHREIVQLTEMLQSSQYNEKHSPLTLALGKDISGQAVTADLGRMPHLLVAGTTGSGKSVAVNSMLISLLYKATAKDVRLILIDPKMLELNVYDGIPHLLSPVVTDMKEAANALRWCVGEMERRYTLMAELKVRNIAGYNKKVNEAIKTGTPIIDPLYQAELSLTPTAAPPTLEPMPFIVVVVDEFADMMMQVGKKAEELIARIAQKARAAGIHLVLATQRPSVDVITGLIKANVPTRIAFQVSSKIDSRTILDQGGAESLLGHGDMLYLPPGTALPMRVHGAFVDDHEVQNVIAHIKQTGEPNYIEEILQESTVAIPGISGGESESSGGESDALYDQAVAVVLESRKASISYVQRRLKIGYNRAARMVEEMEAAGVVSQVTASGTREVLAPPPG
jgi:S-DNA-T family DNA segregation ATPase FtsK/SpoIIIE